MQKRWKNMIVNKPDEWVRIALQRFQVQVFVIEWKFVWNFQSCSSLVSLWTKGDMW